MEAHLGLIRKFYTAFATGDADAMVSCYHQDVTFEDPAFGSLDSEDAPLMWRMLLSRSNGLKITYHSEWADGETGGAMWEAHYEFGKNKRQVHNKISASFQFKDGLIVEHIDRFDFWRWSRMALGLPGVLLGWSPIIKSKVRKTVTGLLADFKEKQSS